MKAKKRILFTKRLDNSFVERILGSDFEVDFLKCIETENLEIKDITIEDESLVFSSKNAVSSFLKNNFILKENKIYCVGESSGNLLKEAGMKVIFIAKNSEELLEYIKKNTRNEKLMHFCGNLVLETLENGCKELGIFYRKIFSYQTKLFYPKVEKEYDYIVFFSPSGVRSFMKENKNRGKIFFSIGEITTQELYQYKKKVVTSQENRIEDLLNLIKHTIAKIVNKGIYDKE